MSGAVAGRGRKRIAGSRRRIAARLLSRKRVYSSRDRHRRRFKNSHADLKRTTGGEESTRLYAPTMAGVVSERGEGERGKETDKG